MIQFSKFIPAAGFVFSATAFVVYHIKKHLSTTFLFFSVIFITERREWDSNPCALADKRFSRPPRYDHFDISPDFAALSATKNILTCYLSYVNNFFYFFSYLLLFTIFEILFSIASPNIISSFVVILILK